MIEIVKKYLPEVSAVLAIVALLGWGTVQTFRLEAARNETARVTLEFEQYKLDQRADIQRVSKTAIQTLSEVNDYGKGLQQQDAQALDFLRSELAASHLVNERLRQQNASLRAAHSTPTAADCQAAIERLNVYTIVYGECTREYSEMARIAGERGTSGIICERSYDSMERIFNQSQDN